MRSHLRFVSATLIGWLVLSSLALSSAYNARPKLIVVIVIDQFRGDYLERYRDQFGENGFRLFLDHGAVFTDCNYDYANLHTAPGHATLLTGAYSDGHGIFANEWWDPKKQRVVTSVYDDSTKTLGVPASSPGSSPHNLLASTLGDELKLATQGKSRVYGISMKDRAAVLAAGWAGDGAYWIDQNSGAWITSTYYRNQLPQWVRDFNRSGRADKYWNLEWKDASGKILRRTAHDPGKPFFYVIGATPFANDYELEFAREMISNEKLGNGPATDLLVVSLSANDILGHEVGPDAPESRAMALALDRQLSDFFSFLGNQIGLANLWIALCADHGVAPVPAVAKNMHIPAAALDSDQLRAEINKQLSAKFSSGNPKEFVRRLDYPVAFPSEEAFTAAKISEADAEQAVGKALVHWGMRGYFTRTQLERGEVPPTKLGRQYLHSYSPHSGWYVLGVPAPFVIAGSSGTDHGSPYTYDTHVPLAFYGLAFQPGTYRTSAEPVDLAPTLASLLGINAPSASVGRVLTEALVTRRVESGIRAAQQFEPHMPGRSPGALQHADRPGSRQ
jgi:predicted AlkP superfamily pyrophosphatase or phosphodiesterase